MESRIKLSEAVQQLLRCPGCKAKLRTDSDRCQCENLECHCIFPMINGIPILIDDNSSIFSIDDFTNHHDTYFLSRSKFEDVIERLIPDISKNIKGRKNFEKVARLLLSRSSTPRVLVIGGSILGAGMESLSAYPCIELVNSDVAFGPHTALVCDAHNLPFEDNAFDGVVVQAVLEHVVDPWQCVEEIHRVLKEDGLVYADCDLKKSLSDSIPWPSHFYSCCSAYSADCIYETRSRTKKNEPDDSYFYAGRRTSF
jgi:uncharacterized protein YbaR (Trm112 family)